MKNHEIAGIFGQMADLLEILGENAFRVNSYRKASRVVDELTADVEDLSREGKLSEISGIGERTTAKICEFLETGKISAHQELLVKVPKGLLDLLKIPGMGPKTTMLAWKQLGVEDVEGLTKVLRTGQMSKLPGMGPKKVENILKGIEFLSHSAGRIPIGIAKPIADEIVSALKKISGVKRVEVAGSLRRWSETVGDIDILIQAGEGEKVLKRFIQFDFIKEVLAAGETKVSVRIADDIQVDVRALPEESFGAAWQYFTGSKAHNVRLRELAVKRKWKLNEYGLFEGEKCLAGKSEEEIYETLELPFFPPELREDRGEFENAKNLPTLISVQDIKGDLHMHTTASDGTCSIDEMIEACIKRGYEYMAFSDHSPSSRVANGLDAKRLSAHIKKIRSAADRYKNDIVVLAGSEVDILSDGELDYDNSILAELDFAIASLHSALGQPEEKIMHRLFSAMDNPHIRMIGHPTARLIGQREAVQLKISEILNRAVQTNTWLELNSSWQRLDLNDLHCRQAKDAGAKILICTDAHDTNQLDSIVYGVYTARRGWIEAKDVINTLPAKEFCQLLKKGK
jgi:DNA polymerase (family 10)